MDGEPKFRNQHLSYAITWYGLALSLLFVYFSYHVSSGRLIFKRINEMDDYIKYSSTRGGDESLSYEEVLFWISKRWWVIYARKMAKFSHVT